MTCQQVTLSPERSPWSGTTPYCPRSTGPSSSTCPLSGSSTSVLSPPGTRPFTIQLAWTPLHPVGLSFLSLLVYSPTYCLKCQSKRCLTNQRNIFIFQLTADILTNQRSIFFFQLTADILTNQRSIFIIQLTADILTNQRSLFNWQLIVWLIREAYSIDWSLFNWQLIVWPIREAYSIDWSLLNR